MQCMQYSTWSGSQLLCIYSVKARTTVTTYSVASYDLISKRVNCDRCCGYGIRYTPHIPITIFFHLFGCYWATQFFIASSATVIAGSVASYHWACGETSPEIPFLPVFGSMKRLMRYSLGSVALGSRVVSSVESVGFFLESVRRKLKVADTTPDSWIGKVLHHTSGFCLGCIEWTIKSVNRNAYIMILPGRASAGPLGWRPS